MSTALCLLAYGVAVAVLGPRALRWGTRGGRAPWMGVAIWLLAMLSVLVAWTGALALVVVQVALSPDTRHVLTVCVTVLCAAAVGVHGTPGQWGVLAGAGAVAAGFGWGAGTLCRALGRSRRSTHRHAEAAHLIGHPDRRLGVVVLDAPERVVYAVAGRPAAIVMSRGALEALDDEHVRVIIAHERAHLVERHHLVLAFSAALATMMPRVPLFTAGTTELGRLVEMCADDAAARDHDPRMLVGALLALAGPPPLPRSALAAASSGVAERAERLLTPPTRAQVRVARTALATGIVGLVAGPVLAAITLCGALIGGL